MKQNQSKKVKFIVYITLTITLSIYSFAVGQWKIFPHELLKNIGNTFEEQSEEVITDSIINEKIFSEVLGYGEVVSLNSFYNFENYINADLNNFEFKWQRLNVDEIGKVGAAELIDGNLWYVNQNSPNLIEYLSLTNATYSEVKAIFSLSGERYAYVVYIQNDCASARLVSLSDKHIALQLSCLPVMEADMNGTGGAWLKISENEILISTGTPTSSHVDNQINKEAQSDQSLWGKILRIKMKNNEIIVDVFSKGHRNPQGITKIEDDIIAAEHGPRGGDEVNIIIEGGNYGWPIQSLGSGYDLEPINKSYNGDISTKLPLFSFVPSIGISDAKPCPDEYIKYYAPNRCVAVASMRAGSIYFVVYNEDKVLFTEKIEFGSRIRKFMVEENTITAVTDYEGIIMGKLITRSNSYTKHYEPTP
jgi:hypothetical protein